MESAPKNAGRNSKADVVLSRSCGSPGQWFPETEYLRASAIFVVGTSGIPPSLNYRSVSPITCNFRNYHYICLFLLGFFCICFFFYFCIHVTKRCLRLNCDQWNSFNFEVTFQKERNVYKLSIVIDNLILTANFFEQRKTFSLKNKPFQNSF